MVLFRAPTKLSLVKCLAGPEINENNTITQLTILNIYRMDNYNFKINQNFFK